MKQFKFELGIEVKDLLSGFKGIIMNRTEYLTGCNRYGVGARGLAAKDEKAREWRYFDEQMLEPTGKQFQVPGTAARAKPGGPTIPGQDAPQH